MSPAAAALSTRTLFKGFGCVWRICELNRLIKHLHVYCTSCNANLRPSGRRGKAHRQRHHPHPLRAKCSAIRALPCRHLVQIGLPAVNRLFQRTRRAQRSAAAGCACARQGCHRCKRWKPRTGAGVPRPLSRDSRHRRHAAVCASCKTGSVPRTRSESNRLWPGNAPHSVATMQSNI